MSYQKPPTSFPGQQHSYQQTYSKPVTQTSGMAVASLVLGLFSGCLSIVTGIPAIILGFVAILKINKSQGALSGKGFAIAGIVLSFGSAIVSGVLVVLLWAGLTSFVEELQPAFEEARRAGDHFENANNLREIGIAIHSYEHSNRNLPLAGAEENLGDNELPEGSQLSWRVHILPNLGHEALYGEFHLDEPWDSAHNLSLLPRMPEVYKSAKSPSLRQGFTTFLAAVPGSDAKNRTILMPSKVTKLSDVHDGLSNTIMVIDAGESNAVEWSRPLDYEVDWHNPHGKIEFDALLGANFLLGDGSIVPIEKSVEPETLRWLFFADDGNVVPLF